jgi:RNA-directed DNA polymerase
VRTAKAVSSIEELNPKIRGWANYHRHMASSRTFEHVDHVIFHALRRWAANHDLVAARQ